MRAAGKFKAEKTVPSWENHVTRRRVHPCTGAFPGFGSGAVGGRGRHATCIGGCLLAAAHNTNTGTSIIEMAANSLLHFFLPSVLLSAGNQRSRKSTSRCCEFSKRGLHRLTRRNEDCEFILEAALPPRFRRMWQPLKRRMLRSPQRCCFRRRCRGALEMDRRLAPLRHFQRTSSRARKVEANKSFTPAPVVKAGRATLLPEGYHTSMPVRPATGRLLPWAAWQSWPPTAIRMSRRSPSWLSPVDYTIAWHRRHRRVC